MKKIALMLLIAVVGVGVLWAEAPETVGTGYSRPALHYFDGSQDFVNSDVFFKLDSMDYETGLDYLQFSLDGGPFMRYMNPFQLLIEGSHEISYRAYDNSRNIEIAKTYPVIVDNTAPKASIQTTIPLYKKGFVKYCSPETKWYVAAHDNAGGAGVASGYIGTDMDALEAYGKGEESEDAYYTLETEGETEVYFSSIDNVGNLTPIEMTSVIVDATAPVVFIQSNDRLVNIDDEYTIFPSEEVVDNEGRIMISSSEAVAFGATDELSGVEAIYVKINDDEYNKYIEPINFNSNETYNLEVKAVDNVGNISEPVSYTFYVDKIVPQSELDLIDKDGTPLETVKSDDADNADDVDYEDESDPAVEY